MFVHMGIQAAANPRKVRQLSQLLVMSRGPALGHAFTMKTG